MTPWPRQSSIKIRRPARCIKVCSTEKNENRIENMQFKLMGRNKLRQAKKQSQVSGPIFSTARGLGVCLILRSYEGRFSESFAFFRCSKVVESMRYFRMASRSAGYVRTRGPESLKKRHLCSDGPASNSDMVACSNLWSVVGSSSSPYSLSVHVRQLRNHLCANVQRV